MKIKCFGPNLKDQSKGDFHIHAADCGDCKFYGAGKKFGGEGGYAAEEAATTKELAMSIYGPDEFGYDADDPDEMAGYEADQWYAPCIKIGEGGALTPAK